MDHVGVSGDDGGRELSGKEPVLGIRRSDGQGVQELGDCMLHPNPAVLTAYTTLLTATEGLYTGATCKIRWFRQI